MQRLHGLQLDHQASLDQEIQLEPATHAVAFDERRRIFNPLDLLLS